MRRNWNSKPCPSGEEEGSEGWGRYFFEKGKGGKERICHKRKFPGQMTWKTKTHTSPSIVGIKSGI